MDLSNRLSLGGLVVSYYTYQMALAVIEKQGDNEIAYRWFYFKKKTEAFCIEIIMDKAY